MNKVDFTLPGGFPLDQEILALLQDNSSMAANAALLGGSQYIMKGCVQTGSNVTNGIVFFSNEVLPFVGGTATTKVIIVETVTALTYEDGSTPGSQKVRYATFGDDGVTTILWADFKRIPVDGLIGLVNTMLGWFGSWQTSNSTTGASHTSGGSVTGLSRKWNVQKDVIVLSFNLEITTTVAQQLTAFIPLPFNAVVSSVLADLATIRIVSSSSSNVFVGIATPNFSPGDKLLINNSQSLPADTYFVGGQITYQKA